MAVAHALTFPDLFAPGGLFGAGPDSTAWLYVFWHGGFPLAVITYALGKDRDAASIRHVSMPRITPRSFRQLRGHRSQRLGARLTDMQTLGTSVRLLSKPYRKEDLARPVREVLND